MENFKIKLDKTDRKILTELDKNCRIPLTQLSKKVRKSRQSVEYRINQLVRKGVISSFNANINPHKLGFKLCKIYLQLRNKAEERKKLIDFIIGSCIVNWFGECDGAWDLIFSLFVKTDYDFFRFRNEILSKFEKIIIKEKEDIIIDIQQYPKMYFTDQINPPVLLAGEVQNNQLDKTDLRILAEIVKNARSPVTELSRKAGISPTIVRTRLNRLEKTGIINQYRVGVDLNKLGLELYKTIIHLQRYSDQDEKRLFTYISQIPNIQYLIRNLTQIEFEFVVSNYHEYNEIINNIKTEFLDMIRNVESVIMKSDIWIPSFIT